MPRRHTVFLQGNYYHIYNRGANKQKIFYETDNYVFFLRRLKKYTIQYAIRVIAYCLMPNHFHLLLRIDGDHGLSRCLSQLLNAYVKAMNKKYGRTGPLFSDRFKSILVEKNNYLIHICRYIHLNPLTAGLVTDLENWPFSNYLEFIGKRNGVLYDASFRNSNFQNHDGYKEFVIDDTAKPPKDFGKFTLGAEPTPRGL